MQSDEPKPQQHNDGIVDKLFHHGHHTKEGEQQDPQAAPNEASPPKKESEMGKFKDYVKKDEELEQQGDAYGGLM